jgi:hypothetical protein
VPGPRAFVKNMVAGATGIDLCLCRRGRRRRDAADARAPRDPRPARHRARRRRAHEGGPRCRPKRTPGRCARRSKRWRSRRRFAPRRAPRAGLERITGEKAVADLLQARSTHAAARASAREESGAAQAPDRSRLLDRWESARVVTGDALERIDPRRGRASRSFRRGRVRFSVRKFEVHDQAVDAAQAGPAHRSSRIHGVDRDAVFARGDWLTDPGALSRASDVVGPRGARSTRSAVAPARDARARPSSSRRQPRPWDAVGSIFDGVIVSRPAKDAARWPRLLASSHLIGSGPRGIASWLRS